MKTILLNFAIMLSVVASGCKPGTQTAGESAIKANTTCYLRVTYPNYVAEGNALFLSALAFKTASAVQTLSVSDRSACESQAATLLRNGLRIKYSFRNGGASRDAKCTVKVITVEPSISGDVFYSASPGTNTTKANLSWDEAQCEDYKV